MVLTRWHRVFPLSLDILMHSYAFLSECPTNTIRHITYTFSEVLKCPTQVPHHVDGPFTKARILK